MANYNRCGLPLQAGYPEQAFVTQFIVPGVRAQDAMLLVELCRCGDSGRWPYIVPAGGHQPAGNISHAPCQKLVYRLLAGFSRHFTRDARRADSEHAEKIAEEIAEMIAAGLSCFLGTACAEMSNLADNAFLLCFR